MWDIHNLDPGSRSIARPSSNFYSSVAIVERANSTDSAARLKSTPFCQALLEEPNRTLQNPGVKLFLCILCFYVKHSRNLSHLQFAI